MVDVKEFAEREGIELPNLSSAAILKTKAIRSAQYSANQSKLQSRLESRM